MGEPRHYSYEDILDELLRYTNHYLRSWRSLKARVSAEDLIHDVWSRLLDRGEVPDTAIEALKLMKTCIINQARSYHRRFDRIQDFGDFPENNERLSSQREESELEKGEHLKNLLPHFQQIQALTKSEWDSNKRVCYYAVFLMDLRLAVSCLLGRSLSEDDLTALLEPNPDFHNLSSLIEALLTWSQNQKELPFKKDWASIGQTWMALNQAINTYPHDVPAHLFCERLQDLLEKDHLRANTWHKWIERARDQAYKEYGKASWKTYFKPFLGAPRRREAGRTNGS